MDESKKLLFRVSITKQYTAVSFSGCEDVSDLNELKEILKGKGANYISLTFYTFFDNDLHYHKHGLRLEELSDDDFNWLIEKTGYDTRSVMY